MQPADIRRLSAVINCSFLTLINLIDRASCVCADKDVLANLHGLRGGIADLSHDYLLGGLEVIADRRDECEDSPDVLAAQTRNDMLRGLD